MHAKIRLGTLFAAAIAVFFAYYPAHFKAATVALAQAVSPSRNEAAVLFGGDMMFDRSIRVAGEVNGGDYLLKCLDPVLKGNDLVVANLEGPITDNPSRSVGSAVGSPDNFVFTFPPSTAALLKSHHIDMVNLGNNHITNFGDDGIFSTEAALQKAGVGFFGDPYDSAVATTTINGVKLAFINYNEYIQPERQGEASSAELAISQIKEARASGYLPVVFTHWGVEYDAEAPDYVHAAGHQFIDAGAELVIGTSPHVVEESEQYKGKYVFYSLGNLIFDQYFSDAVDHGLLVRATFDEHGVTSVSTSTVILKEDRQTCPV